jgi:uncharacterized membrane protein YtjA (UPF0391 family)
LPATFIYGFEGDKLPDKITEKTGEGFEISNDGKIITRYTCGVAILQAPIFFVIHLIAGANGQTQDGFSGIYHLVSSIAAILYAFLGVVLMLHFLRTYFSKWIAVLSLLSIFLGTNLLYYTIDATGMSHIYSFFLFSLLLVLSKYFFSEINKFKKIKYFAFVALVSSLIVLIRPTNLAFLAMVFVLDTTSWKDIKDRFVQILKPINILILLIVGLIVFLPQMMYWKYSFGSFVVDSYEGYGFSNLASPNIVKFLFSTNNGLFTYNPIYFLFLGALFFMIKKKQLNGYFILVLFLGLIYLFSSWFIFSFGCGYGSRNFVEYTTVFVLPIGFLYEKMQRIIGWGKRFVIIIASFFILINLKLVSAYDKCFLGSEWDKKEYSHFLKSRKLNKEILLFKSESLTPLKEYSKSIVTDVGKTALVNYRRAIVSVNAETDELYTEALIVLSIESNDSTIYWNSYSLKNGMDERKPGEKQKVIGDFWLPRDYTIDSKISTFVWNIGKDSLRISNFKIHLE